MRLFLFIFLSSFLFLLHPPAIHTYTHATYSVFRPCNSHIGRSKGPRSCFVENNAAFLHLLVASFVQAKRSRPSSQYRYMTLVVAATDASPIQRRHYNHFLILMSRIDELRVAVVSFFFAFQFFCRLMLDVNPLEHPFVFCFLLKRWREKTR